MQLGPSKSRALLAFHSLTGCDTTSAFQGKGKRTAWAVRQEFPELTAELLHLSTFPSKIDDYVMSYVEAFIVRLYDHSLDITSVNAAGMDLFNYKGRNFDNFPPTKDALLQQILRAAY